MTTSEKIRLLARDGLSTAEIAKRLKIRYQHAYNVLKQGRTRVLSSKPKTPKPIAEKKPELQVPTLISGGFTLSSRWMLSSAGGLVLEKALPKLPGVYAFAKNGTVMYVGVATMGLSKRLYFYAKPGSTQRTSQRINGILKQELSAAGSIDILTACPDHSDWNGLPIHTSAGLELGLIQKYGLPWNIRSAG